VPTVPLRSALSQIPWLRRAVQDLRLRRRAWSVGRDPDQTALLERLRASLSLPALPTRRRRRGEIWAISLVRNEADIIESTIRHLLAQGVDRVLIADNLSSDATPEILARLARTAPVHVGRDSEPAYYQALKMGLLADRARRSGADWIVPFDADEFWFGGAGTLADHLRRSGADVLRADLHNLFPIRAGSKVGGDGWRLQRRPHVRGKVAYRTHPAAVLAAGNHEVERPGVAATGLKIVHVPWRSEEQFRRKAMQGAAALAATNLSLDTGFHWRHLATLDDDAIGRQWRQLLAGESVEGIEWSPTGDSVAAPVWDWRTWDPTGLLAPEEQAE